MTTTDTTTAYPHIRAWGALLGSHAHYVNSQIDKAIEDNAPADAIYEVHQPGVSRTHRWATAGEITHTQNAETVAKFVDNLRRTGSVFGRR